MIKLLLITLISMQVSAAEVGWTKNGFVANSIVSTGIKTETITSDDQAIDVNGFAIVKIDSDDSNATQRSFIPLPGNVVGQTVRLVCSPAGGNSTLNNNAVIPGAGIVKLGTASWSCTQPDDAQKLIWNGTDWVDDGEINI